MRSRKLISTAIALSLGATLVLSASGCYKRVVDARGIGGDSSKLRERQEREPLLRDALTTSKEREKGHTSGVW